jgi:ABC-type antimicrobial peptide transport system permease subunit
MGEMSRWILPRAAAAMFGLCGSMGLLITVVGLYGVISFAVARRTREIGVRMALGARRGQVLAMVLRHGLLLTLMGCCMGTAAAFAVSHVARSLLYGITPGDPVTFVLAPLFLVAVSLLACLVPARRAASLDPAGTLRWE